MTTKDEAEQKEAPISDLEITGTLIQARDAMAPMRGLILFDQAIERINKLLAQQKEAQQEPVAWMHYEDESVLTSHEKDVNVADLSPDFLAGHNTPLYYRTSHQHSTATRGAGAYGELCSMGRLTSRRQK